MLSVIRILNKVLVARFYQQNSGLLLFVFFLMFGIVEGSQLVYYHLSLAYGMLESPALLGIVFAVWMAYVIKCILFIRGALCEPQNSFLFSITNMPFHKQFIALFVCQVTLFIPVISYASFVIGVAIHGGKLISACLVVAYLVLLCIIASVISVQKLNSPVRANLLPPFISLTWRKPLWQFYFAYIFSDLKIIFTVTKAFSYFVLFGFLLIDVGHYEIRTALMGMLIGLAAHSVLIFEFRKWEDSYLPFLKNLPIPMWKRFLTLALIYFLILLPEWILLIANRIGFIDFAGLLLFGTAFLLFLHTTLYKVFMDMDRYIQRVLFLFLIGFGLVLFKMSWMVMIILWIFSFRWFRKYFYEFESLRL